MAEGQKPKDVSLHDRDMRGISSEDEGSGERALHVHIKGSSVPSSGSTEYTEGDTDTSFTGPVVLAEGPSNTATPLQVDSDKNLLSTVRGRIVHGDPFDIEEDLAIRIAGMDETQVNQLDVTVTPSGNKFCLDVNIAEKTGQPLSISGSVDTELPAAAALADNTANPTVPGIGAFLMAFDGSTWDRVLGNSGGGLVVQGPANDNAAAAGRPVRIGGVFNSTEPTYADLDIADLQVNNRGHLKTAVRRQVFTTELDPIENVFNSAAETVTSDAIDLILFDYWIFYFTLAVANTPTHIIFEFLFSPDNSTYYPCRVGPMARLIFTDTAIGSGRSEPFPLPKEALKTGRYLKIKATSSGTDATNTITTSACQLEGIK